MRLGDLDALKEKVALMWGDNNHITESMNEIINNAPTVETDIEVIAKDAYEHGYTDGWKERYGEPNERPQGEWIMQLHNCDGEFYTCSVCGRMIRVSPYIEDNETLEDYPFCHCGAAMRGKE